MNKNIRMDALKAAGIDTNSFISITGLKPGDTVSFTLDANGNMNMSMSDAVVNNILSNGYVKNTKLYRRWIAAQTLRILWKVEHGNYNSYDDYVRKNYKYMYQFKFMENEIKVLAELEKADKESFEERVHFFSKNNIVQIYREYVTDLNTVKSLSLLTIRSEIVNRFTDLAMNIDHMDYATIYAFVSRLNRKLIDLTNTREARDGHKFGFSRTWLDTFKGEGAYYTLKNLVLFHGLEIRESQRRCRTNFGRCMETTYVAHKGRDAFNYIKDHLDEYKCEGWRYMAMLKKCLADNNFDITKLY